MRVIVYLIVNEDGGVSVRKNQPRPRLGEVIVPLRLQIPEGVFRPKIPQAIAIDVPEQHIAQPIVETFEPPPTDA